MEELNKMQEQEFYKRGIVKAKTNLLYFSLFTVVMFFAGLTSAFLVSKGGGFWVSLQLPKALIYSTITIVISSITMYLGLLSIKKDKKQATTLFLVATLVLGLLFGYFQSKGWGEVYDKGYAVTGKIMDPMDDSKFMVDGEYGKDFTLFYGGNELIKENEDFYYWGKKAIQIDEEEYEDFSKNNPNMVFGSELLELKKGEVKDPKTKKTKTEFVAVVKSKNILTPNQRAKLADQGNTSASYFYVLTVAHLLHIIGCLFYVLLLLINSLIGKYSKSNYLSIKLGGYFWHFLGGLWVYLFCFLYFIH